MTFRNSIEEHLDGMANKGDTAKAKRLERSYFKDLLHGAPPGSELDTRVAMACNSINKIFYGSYIHEDGLFDLYLIAKKAKPVPKTERQLLEAAITEIQEGSGNDIKETRKDVLARLEKL